MGRQTQKPAFFPMGCDLFKYSSKVIFFSDIGGKIVSMNPAGARFLGKPISKIEGRHISQLIPPEEARECIKAIKTVFRTGKPLEREFFHKMGGRSLCISTEMLPVKRGGKTVLAAAMCRDETFRKKKEEALSMGRALFNSVPSGIAYLDREYRLVDFNNAYARMIGEHTSFSPEKARGMKYWDYVPGSKPQVHEWYRQSMDLKKTTSAYGFPLVITTKRGKTTTYWDTTVAPVVAEGKTLGIVITTNDATSREEAFRDLKREKEWSETILESAPSIIVALGENSRIELFNKAAEGLLGYSESEVLGKRWIDLFIPARERKRLHAVWGEVMSSKGVHSYENPVLAKSGEEIIVSWQNRGLVMGGEPLVLSIGQDVTELRKAEERLRRLDRLKSDFVINVSHELRTPITSMVLSMGLLKKEKDLKKRKEMLQILDRNVHRLSHLVDNVLDFSLAESGKLVLRKRKLQLNDILEGVLEELSPMAEIKGLKLTTALSPLPKIRGNREWLARAISNVVHNSIKFTDKGGVKISSRMEGRHAVVEIRDTGMGIREADLPEIFGKFVKFEEHLPGTGVGLAIAKHTVDWHKGEITAKSKRGRGTTITIRLPTEVKK